jgi:hypothetical protein
VPSDGAGRPARPGNYSWQIYKGVTAARALLKADMRCRTGLPSFSSLLLVTSAAPPRQRLRIRRDLRQQGTSNSTWIVQRIRPSRMVKTSLTVRTGYSSPQSNR